jgi:hypothetical protein
VIVDETVVRAVVVGVGGVAVDAGPAGAADVLMIPLVNGVIDVAGLSGEPPAAQVATSDGSVEYSRRHGELETC